VTEVHYSSLRIDSTDDALHDPGKRVCVAEIGGERYEHRITRERGEMNLTETKVQVKVRPFSPSKEKL
jgi:hypothetical protein